MSIVFKTQLGSFNNIAKERKDFRGWENEDLKKNIAIIFLSTYG